MTGTIINSLTILIAGLLGLSVGRFLPRPMTVTMQSAMGILIVAIGLGYTIKAENVALVGLSLVLQKPKGKRRTSPPSQFSSRSTTLSANEFRRVAPSHRLREIIALCLAAPRLTQPGQLFERLHPLGNRIQVQHVSHIDDGAQHI